MPGLIETWHPVTKDIGFIQCPIERAVTELSNWHAAIDIEYLVRNFGSLKASFEFLPPLSTEKQRKLFIPTESGWTAFMQSGIDGSDPFPTMSELSRRLGVLSMRVCATQSDATWPSVIWEVYAPSNLGGNPLGHRRSIAASNDGGRWTFSSIGEPYPFEQVDAYSRPRKRDRFTRELLDLYLREFKLNPFRDDFYAVSSSRSAVGLERTSRWSNRPPEFTLAEVSAGLPWR